jgi:OHCU decarboxylase
VADDTPSVPLASLDDADEATFVALVGAVFEHTPAIAAGAWRQRPFADVDALHEAMCAVVRDLDEAAQLELLRAHPELGARRPMAVLSVQEQRGAGLDRVDDDVAARLAELNQQYRERFGFPFIIAVRGRSPLEILAEMHQRMTHSAETERATALEQVTVIAGLRLHDLVSDGDAGTAVRTATTRDGVEPSTPRPLRAVPGSSDPSGTVDAVDNATAGLEHAWHPVAVAAEVGDEPVRVLLLDQAWVLFRTEGQVHALVDRCVHRGAPLSAGCVVDGTIECPYHGWRFEPGGACVDVPALAGRAPSRARLDAPWGVVERYGLIWMAPEEPAMELISVPEAEDTDFGVVVSRPVRTTASAAQVVDNFLDVTHFSYLHRATFGLSAPVTVEDYVVERGPWQVTLHHRTMFSAGDESARPRVGHYHCTIPFSVRLVGEFPGTSRRDVICLFAQPETPESTRIYKLLAFDELGPGSPGDRTLESMDDFETAVLAEDVRMLELLPERRVPLAPTAEFHTKADRATVEWRRLLRALLSEGLGASGQPVAVPAPRRSDAR